MDRHGINATDYANEVAHAIIGAFDAIFRSCRMPESDCSNSDALPREPNCIHNLVHAPSGETDVGKNGSIGGLVMSLLGENFFDDMSVNVGQTAIDTVLAVNQSLMVDA